MAYTLRPYQQEAVDKAVAFFLDTKEVRNGIEVLPTAAGKSLVIANIALNLNANVLVLQPSREILMQNYDKMCSYGYECSMYSASVGVKEVSRVTFATIGSIKSKSEDFKHFKYCIVDECHLSQTPTYKKFFKDVKCKVLGVTATPYKLETDLYKVDKDGNKKRTWQFKTKLLNKEKGEHYESESQLRFLTHVPNALFKKVVYVCQPKDLYEQGFLAKVNYYSCPPPLWNDRYLIKNKNGSEYTEESMRIMRDYTKLDDWLVNVVERLLNPKNGVPRKCILVFTHFIDEAERLKRSFRGIAEIVTGETSKKERERIIEEFKKGKIKVVVNASCLTTGFDYPELDTIVMARATMSLSLYYQIVGREIRIHPSKKEAWFVDLCHNYDKFGDVIDLNVNADNGYWQVSSNGRQITGVNLNDIRLNV